MLQLALDVHLDSSAQFQNFYFGRNKQAFERLRNLTPEASEFLYCWGALGSGKSHLAQALCKVVSDRGATVSYLPLSHPALEPSILQGLELVDLVCLDSIESVVGNSDWEEALFYLFNLLKSTQRSLVIFGCHSPKASNWHLADLESRLNSMEVYKIKRLRESEMALFLTHCGQQRGLDLSSEVVAYILSRAKREAKDLIHLVDRLDSASLAQQRKITIPFVKKRLKW